MMNSLVRIESPQQLLALDTSALHAFDPACLSSHKPDAHWVALNPAGKAAGRISLWWSHTPLHENHRLGYIGHFAANDPDTSAQLLNHATKELATQGRTLAVGPIDGNTWRRYRFITERGTEPSFFLEPDNPDEWPLWFENAGFRPWANYLSALNDHLVVDSSRLAQVKDRLEQQGIYLRPLAMDDFRQELLRIFDVTLQSFKNNLLYSPITESEFIAQYESVHPFLDPRLIWLAECQSHPIGFAFALPDVCQTKRGVPTDTIVLKTLAVIPEHRSSGLGDLLLQQCQEAAQHLGYRRVIHALMHESNRSLRISSHYARPFRRYTLFAREL